MEQRGDKPAAEPREQASAELRATASAFERLVSTLPGVVYRCRFDADWTMLFLGGRCREVLGYGPSQLLLNRERSFGSLIHPEDRQRVRDSITHAAERRETFQLSYRILDPDGQTRWLLEQGMAVRDGDDQVVNLEGYIANITEQKRLEQEMIRAVAIENVGRLTSGIAHDLNNILTAIGSYAEFLRHDTEPGSSSRADATQIVDAVQRASNLTRQILAFTRGQLDKPRLVCVDERIADLSKLLIRLLGEHISVQLELHSEQATVRIDPGQLEQVLVNLAVNARDAMPEGGRIRVRTRTLELDETAAKALSVAPGTYLELTVRDSGDGIAPSALPHIFEPFFTTKEYGKGTGLGLATVQNILRNARGGVRVESIEGEGSTFSVYLPVVSAPAEPLSTREPVERLGGSESILIVDDDHAVRSAVARTLAGSGYDVTVAENPGNALAAIEARSFDLLVTDVVLPVMSGPELARIFQRAHGQGRVLFMTGHAILPAPAHALGPKAAVLPKPFSPNALLHEVRNVLDER